MALPKEPRQKMINLMYLVLTALLALNVSAEILNAFKTVDNSLTKTNAIVNASTTTIMKSFEDKMQQPESREKAEIWMPKAQATVQLASAAYGYIQQIKEEILKRADYNPSSGDSTFKEDNIDIATKYLISEGEGKKLYAALDQFRKQVVAIDPLIAKEFENSLPIDLSIPKTTDNIKDWSTAYFNMTPTIAALTILSKFQNDVRNTENRIVNFCHNQVGQVAVRFDTYAPIVGANSTYLFPGQELEVRAGIGAFSKNAQPQITIGGRTIPLDENGVAIFKTQVGAGGGSIPVRIKFKDQEGKDREEVREIQYTVGTPTGSFVSAEKVKVLYIGLDNELAVTGGSVGDEKVSITIDNGTVRKIGPGRYLSNPATPGTAKVKVNADGKVSEFSFRVKTVPDPVAMVGASKGGRIQANVFKAQQGVRAELENFVFEGVNFTVTGYTFYATGAGFSEAPGVMPNVGGNSFAPVQDIISKCRPGSTVVIDEIRAQGPGGGRKLAPIVFNLY